MNRVLLFSLLTPVFLLASLFTFHSTAFACPPGEIDTFDGQGCMPSGATPAGGGGTTGGTVGGGGTTGGSVGGGGTTGGTVGGGGTTGGSPGTLQNPLQSINDLPTLLKVILQAIVTLGSIVLTIMLVWVGFLFVTARGNPEEISKAKTALTWVVIGGLILLGAEAISQVIQATVKTL